jgi:hypothetical protein
MNPINTFRHYREVSSDMRMFEKIRFYIATISLTLGACSWALIPVVIARLVSPISENHALFFIFIPLAILMALWMAPHAPKIAGFSRY